MSERNIVSLTRRSFLFFLLLFGLKEFIICRLNLIMLEL